MATTSARGRRGSNPLVVESISEQLHSILCERITTGVYAPGSRLDPQAIAAEFGRDDPRGDRVPHDPVHEVRAGPFPVRGEGQ
ncbi:hypothetical protein ABZZ85_24980, partial [Streptomyces halstedii]